MNALPQGLKKPETSSGNYLKLQDGDNKIRIITDAIVGWEYWTEKGDERKPVRLKHMPEAIPAEATADKYGNFIKEFYAFGVWNYNENKIQIMQITQVSIQERLFDLDSNEDWGDLKNYDITITRDNEGGRVTYTVTPLPPKDLPMEIANAAAEKPINLNALYEGKDPFDEEYVDGETVAKTLGLSECRYPSSF